MDIEGYAKLILKKGEDISKLAELIAEIKEIDIKKAYKIANAVKREVENAYSKKNFILDYYRSGVKMGEFGVGSRGEGDFYVHSKIAEMCDDAIISPKDLDDAGVVRIGDYYISVAIDGIHSRLSEFPFISGFHVTRAAMRDIYVMGAKPIAIFSDIHIADDGDVSKIFDHLAGITTVSNLMNVPLIAGSTLRIGGDMVIGERMTGAVGCVGISSKITPRKNARIGDLILLTEGSGGGTIATTAIYYGMHEIVEETLNIDFLLAADAIINSPILKNIHSMSDVTNGGIRGDAREISKISKNAIIFDYEKVRNIVNRKVLKMLDELRIDFMGVSIDSLMIICPEEISDDVKKIVKKVGVRIEEVGWVEKGNGAYMIKDGRREELIPKFREAAYTPIKKVIGEERPSNFEELRKRIDRAVDEAKKKREKVVKIIKNKIKKNS